MPTVSLPDGSHKQLPEGATGSDLSAGIGKKLARDAVGLRLDGELADLDTPLSDGQTVEIITKQNPMSYEFLRHSTAHVLAASVQRLYPQAKIAIGPTVEDGFYYDFYIPGHTLAPDDLAAIEAEMKKLIDSDLRFQRRAISDPEAVLSRFRDQGEKFKAELLEEFRDQQPTQYHLVEPGTDSTVWSDLCRGPHLTSTGKVGAFKLLSVSSAYWRGDENRESLQRVYGTAWWSQSELEDFLERRTEAERRDHRKLAKVHDLFSTQEEAGPGLVFWHPKLAFLRTRVEDMWRQLHESSGYQFVYTPHVARRELWEVSGHTQHYLDNMFALQEIDGQEYFLKPMNCPFHMQIFGSRRHSYRELPIRYAELGTVYRFERSGVMHGLARVRGFTQDDAHIFCRPQQLVSEICGVIDLIDRIYRTFELEYTAELSTRPENSIGSDQAWQDAEAGLRQALNEKGLAYEVNEGDGAFYGPKIDFKLRDALGRWWQGATIQLDFNLPERFQLAYTGADGQMHRPVMLHRAIFGSLERFTGLLIEHYGGAFPVWLCQTQVAILPIADRHLDYCYAIRGELADAGLRGSVDPRAEKVNAKIRDAQLEQIPFMLVIGDREMEAGKVSVRERRQGDLGSMSGQEFVRLAKEANLTD